MFVLPASDAEADCRIRIFTPASELPFTGHPAIGTAVLSSELGILEGSEVVLQEEVGNVPIRISRQEHSPCAELSVPGRPEFGTEVPARTVAARMFAPRLGIPEDPAAVPTLLSPYR